ncbi:OsmC family protein (plasmid) [Cylindrospermum sp. NIES-4074]|nr:OsmC family protein [Cylindrospermum sp. NIES-4074]
MSQHQVTVEWQRHQAKFVDNQYSREHLWKFDGGAEIAASSSPQVVPVPYSNAEYVDPEEAFIASLSSCHMLWFLSIAAKHKFVVESYTDRAVGVMSKNEEGKLAITSVHLYPQVIFGKDHLPTQEQIEAMHEEAHHSCFLASSVKAAVIIEKVES